MKRVFLMMLDSLGIGFSSDAYKFNDIGSDTFGHIAEHCFLGLSNNSRRSGSLYIPNLTKLGIVQASKKSRGSFPLGTNSTKDIIASYGFSSEVSSGKDTSSGHWELAGVPVLDEWYYFKQKENSFPTFLIEKILRNLELPGIIGNCHASGTDIIHNFGIEHIQTNKPIIYTSLDSVFQVACHEKYFGLLKLYDMCNVIRSILDKYKYNVARVIARPFIGETPLNFKRTGNRRDFSIKPFETTVMEKLISEKNGKVIAIGKVSDIYAGVGISKKVHASGLDELCKTTIHEMKYAVDNTIIFTNFVDFDSTWGHRRDVTGYAEGLEFFDAKLSEIINLVKLEDLLIVTADHGCDPTWPGTDHTREHVPILIYSPSRSVKFLGHRKTFADIGQTIAKYFHLSDMKYGINML